MNEPQISTLSNWVRGTPAILFAMVPLAILLSGCEWNYQRREATIPAEIIEINDEFLSAIGRGDPEAAARMMADGALDDTGRHQLEEFSESLYPHEDIRITRGSHSGTAAPGLRHHRITSQLSTPSIFYMVALEIREVSNHFEVQALQFARSAIDLERLNRFTFEGRSVMFPLSMLIGFCATAFLIWALVDCWKRKPSSWWIWLPVIMIGFPEFTLNWTSGTWSSSFGTIVPFGIGFGQISRIHPFVLQLGAPIGALAWWIARTRIDLADRNPAQGTEDGDGPPANANESAI